jgi:sugar/nucleoside kinase (ribokinase family)
MYLVIGTTTVDLLITGLTHLPGFEGDEFTTGSLAFCDAPPLIILGGNGANSAYVLATLGAPTMLVSGCGQDLLGKAVLAWLEERGVDLRAFVRHPSLATAATTVIMDDAFNRIAFHHSGVSHALGPDNVWPELVEQAEALLIASYPLLPGFRRGGYLKILKEARRANALTALDIGPAIGEPARLGELVEILQHIDYLIANEHELAVCTATARIDEGVALLLEAGAQHVIVKHGEAGATAWHSSGRHHVPGFVVDAISTIGAGDAFNASFLLGVCEGMELSEALRFGNATAALVVSGARGVLSAPSRIEVTTLLKQE